MEIIGLIISIASLLITSVATTTSMKQAVDQINAAVSNDTMRRQVSNLIKTMRSEIDKGNLSFNKLKSLANSRNAAALSNYLYNNPVVGKSLSALQKDTERLGLVESDINDLTSEINTIEGKLASLGTGSMTTDKQSEYDELKDEYSNKAKELSQKQEEYSSVLKSVGSSTHTIKPNTAHMEAISQNLKGGIQ